MNLCQVTSPDWHPGPFAQWIKKGLDGRSRYWLEGVLVEKTGKSRPTVERAVNRWTRGGGQPKGSYLTALIGLFGDPPPQSEVAAYRDHEIRLTDIEEILKQHGLANIRQAREDLRREGGDE